MKTGGVSAKRRSLDRQLQAILTTLGGCAPTCEFQAKVGCPRDKLPVLLGYPGRVIVTNNGCGRAFRRVIVRRKVPNVRRAKWAANGAAVVRHVVDAAHLAGRTTFATIHKTNPLEPRGYG